MGVQLVITGAREIGFGLFDAGLGLGGMVASENYRRETIDDLKLFFNDSRDAISTMKDSLLPAILGGEADYRLVAEDKFLSAKTKAKVVVGTDFVGLQFKNIAATRDVDLGKYIAFEQKGTFSTDEVMRIATDWDGNDASAVILEKSTKERPVPIPKSWREAGFGLIFQSGARYNTTSNSTRAAVNLKVDTPIGKFGIEWRGEAFRVQDQ